MPALSSASPFPAESRYFKAGIYSGPDSSPYSTYSTSSSVHGSAAADPPKPLTASHAYPRSFPDCPPVASIAQSGHCRNFVSTENPVLHPSGPSGVASTAEQRRESLSHQTYQPIQVSRETPIKTLKHSVPPLKLAAAAPVASAVSSSVPRVLSSDSHSFDRSIRPHSRNGYIRNNDCRSQRSVRPLSDASIAPSATTYRSTFDDKFVVAFSRSAKEFTVPPFKCSGPISSAYLYEERDLSLPGLSARAMKLLPASNQPVKPPSSVSVARVSSSGRFGFKTTKSLDHQFVVEDALKRQSGTIMTADSTTGWLVNEKETLDATELDIPLNRPHKDPNRYSTTARQHFGRSFPSVDPLPASSVAPVSSSAYVREHLNQSLGTPLTLSLSHSHPNSAAVLDRLKRIHGVQPFIHPTIRKQMALDQVAANKNWGKPKQSNADQY